MRITWALACEQLFNAGEEAGMIPTRIRWPALLAEHALVRLAIAVKKVLEGHWYSSISKQQTLQPDDDGNNKNMSGMNQSQEC